MKRLATVLALTLGLAACGADGPPQRPAERAVAAPGPTISGTVEIGVTGS